MSLVVLVVGMHRSGTSALSGALAALGVDFGADEELVSAGPDNPKGFFERVSVVELNDRLLAGRGWSWDVIPASAGPQFSPWSSFVSFGRDLVSALPKGTTVGLKDPRFCLTMPFWRHVLLDRCIVIRIVRDPAEVIWSLMLRDGKSATQSAALLRAYDRWLEEYLDGLPVANCRYEDLVDEPEQTLLSLHSALRAIAPEMAQLDENQLEAASKFVEPLLRRTSVPHSIEASDIVRKCREGRHTIFNDHVVFKPHIACPTVPELWEEDILQLQMRLHSLESEREDLQKVYQSHLAAAQDATDRQIALCRALEVKLGEMQVSHVAQIEDLLFERDGLVTRQRVLEAELASTVQQVDEQVAAVQERLDDVLGRLRRRRSEVLNLERDLELVKKSRSWRIGRFMTAPARAFRRILGF